MSFNNKNNVDKSQRQLDSFLIVKKSEKENKVISTTTTTTTVSVLPSTSSSSMAQPSVKVKESGPPPKRQRLILKCGDSVKKFVLPVNHGKIQVQNEKNEWVELEETDSPLCSQDRIEPPPRPPPTRHTMLDTIRETLILHTEYQGSDDAFAASQLFLNLMKRLPANGTSKLKKQDGTFTHLTHEQKPIIIKWQKENLFYTQRSSWNGANKKCRLCWETSKDKKAGHCRLHSEKNQEILLIRDKISATPVYSVILPHLRMTTQDETSINLYLRSDAMKRYPAISIYMKNHPNLRFVIEKSWKVPTTSATQKFNTISTAMFFLTQFHNINCEEKEKVNIVMGWIAYREKEKKGKLGKGVDWEEVVKILEDNNLVFSTQPLDKVIDRTQSPLLSTPFFKLLPHTYEGHDNKGGVYDGMSFSTRKDYAGNGSIAHYKEKKTGLSNVDKRTIQIFFQLQLTEEEQTVIDMDDDEELEDDEELDDEEGDEDDKELDDEEEGDEDLNDKSKLFKKMKKRALEVEMMGQMATCIATMKKMTNNGHHIHPLTTKLYNLKQGFDLGTLETLFSMKTQMKLVVEQKESLKITSGRVEFSFRD